MILEDKITFTSREEALDAASTGFSNGFPLWIYERGEGFQITSKGYYLEPAPDYCMSFEEFSARRNSEFLYEDIDVEELDVMRLGLNAKGKLTQAYKTIDAYDLAFQLQYSNSIAVITVEYSRRVRAMEQFIKVWEDCIKLIPDQFVGYKPLCNNQFILHLGDSKFETLRELRNVNLFYRALSAPNVIIH